MDQSASVISSANSALYISFFPRLAAEPIPLPITSPLSVFVCANSLVVSDKVVHARTRYNLRAFESLVAARVLANKLGVEVGRGEKVTLREFLGRWLLGVKEGLGQEKEVGVEELKAGLEKIGEKLDVLKLVEGDGSDGTEVGVTLDEMIELSGLSPEEFRDVYLSWANGTSSSNSPMPPAFFVNYSNFYKSRRNALPALQTRQARLLRIPSRPPIPRSLSPRPAAAAAPRLVAIRIHAPRTRQVNGRIAKERGRAMRLFLSRSEPSL